jgi:hypothetical protein
VCATAFVLVQQSEVTHVALVRCLLFLQWSDILAVTIPSPMMVKKEAEEKAKVEREAAAMKTLLRSDVAITVVPTSEVPHRPSRRQLARTGSYVVSPTRSSMPAAKPSSRALVAAPASGAAGGAVKCPAFVPASQSGCKLEDACPLFHEKTLCPTMLASGGDSCTLGFRCPFRHVPLAGPGSRAPYLDVARGAEKDEFGHIPPRDWSTHGRSFYKKSVRKLFTVANTEWETGHLPYDVRGVSSLHGLPVLTQCGRASRVSRWSCRRRASGRAPSACIASTRRQSSATASSLSATCVSARGPTSDRYAASFRVR